MKTVIFLMMIVLLSAAAPAAERKWEVVNKPMHHVFVVAANSGKDLPIFNHVFGKYIKGLRKGDYVSVIEARRTKALLRVSQRINDSGNARLQELRRIFLSINSVARSTKDYKEALDLAFQQIENERIKKTREPLFVILCDGRLSSRELRMIKNSLKIKLRYPYKVYVAGTDKTSRKVVVAANAGYFNWISLDGGEWDLLAAKERPKRYVKVKPKPVPGPKPSPVRPPRRKPISLKGWWWVLLPLAILIVMFVAKGRSNKPSKRLPKIPTRTQKPSKPQKSDRFLYASVNGQNYRLGPTSAALETYIGSARGCRIKLNDKRVSPTHAKVSLQGHTLEIKNLSRDPIKINGAEILNGKKAQTALPCAITLFDGLTVRFRISNQTTQKKVVPSFGAKPSQQ